jgi:hypothetical protein
MSNSEAAEKVISGYRLPKPPGDCPTEIYELMLKCWDSQAEQRPSFEAILQIIISLIGPTKAYQEEEEVVYNYNASERDYTITTESNSEYVKINADKPIDRYVPIEEKGRKFRFERCN